MFYFYSNFNINPIVTVAPIRLRPWKANLNKWYSKDEHPKDYPIIFFKKSYSILEGSVLFKGMRQHIVRQTGDMTAEAQQ